MKPGVQLDDKETERLASYFWVLQVYTCDQNTAMQLLDRLVNYSRILQYIILSETSFRM